ncbi:MAG: hypothetical protein EHM59_02280 [Betaproteobacteria bacterium]|nr:MAG: hypothetical protein EHM59_02280 [Betaproteobacteria bacterium]
MSSAYEWVPKPRSSDKGSTMASHEKISDFLMTGCAIAPVLALCTGQPELALFAHIVLLFGGVGVAACEENAPFRNPPGLDHDRP